MTPARLGIIIALLATTLLGATGAVMYRFAQRTSQPTREAASVSPTQTPSQLAPSPEEFQQLDGSVVPSDWKTYVFEKYPLAFKFPSTFNLTDNAAVPNQTPSVKVNKNGCSIEIFPRIGGFGFESPELDITENPVTINGQKLVIGDNEVTKKRIADKSNGAVSYLSVLSYPDKRVQGINILLNYLSGREDTDCNEMFDQILSTFKFPISDQEKLLIDSWLEQNNLNQYGDAKDTFYAGGTPLFNEATGERMDRYDYIVKKFPERPWNNQ